MPPKRRSVRKVVSPAKVSEVILADKEEKEEAGDQVGEGDPVEQDDKVGEGDPVEEDKGDAEMLEEDVKAEGEGDQGEEVEKEEEATVDLTSDQECGEDEGLDQVEDAILDEPVDANGVEEACSDTEQQPDEAAAPTVVDEAATEAAEAAEAEDPEADEEDAVVNTEDWEESVKAEEEAAAEGDTSKDAESDKKTSEKSDKKSDSKTKEQEDKKKSSFQTESYIKRNLVFKQYMRKEIGADIRLKTVLIYPVTLVDLQDTTLLAYIEQSHRFLLNFNDRLKKHNTEGFLSMSFHTVKEADEAAESLNTWREGLSVRRMHPPESVDKAMNDIKGFDPNTETHCMLFVKFLPESATQDALDELIPGSTSVVIAMNDEGAQRNYGYLTYETAEQAKEAAEKYKDAEMDGTKLLVVHYGTYIDPVAPSSAMPDTKRIHMLHQYRNLKLNYDGKRSTMLPSYKQQTEYRLEMLKSRLETDAELRVKEKKALLGVDQLPSKKPRTDSYSSPRTGSYGHETPKLMSAPRPLATQLMKRRNKPYQSMGMTPRWQSQQVGGGMGMGGGGMARSGGGGGGMMNTQPDATMKAVNMLVGMLSNQLNQPQQPQAQQQQQWGGVSRSTGSGYGGQTTYGAGTSNYAANYSSGGGSGYQSNSGRYNQWGSGSGSSSLGSSYNRGSGSSYSSGGGGSYSSGGGYQQSYGSGQDDGWNRNKRKSGGSGSGQWKNKGGAKKGRWN